MRKRIVSFLLSVAMCLCLLPGRVDAAYFRDVGAHWARSYIEDAVDMGLFNGTSPDHFEPEGPRHPRRSRLHHVQVPGRAEL